ncbi:MAG: ATP-binding protein, partial [Gemmatimonadetes bacterium]|nr:ATP-binding protein [Gemmatimonadota bacterium]
EDEGPGISPRDRRQIWDPYRRLERDVAGEVRGSGIGLAVVAELCSLYGGEAWVEDGEAGGSRFVVELPAGRGTAEDAMPEKATPDPRGEV